MKPRPDLLQRFLLHPAELDPCPPDWQAVFGRQAPLAVEIGFGGGEYMAWQAGRKLDTDFVGIELPPDCIVHGVPHLAEAALSNVRLIQGDARYLLRELFAPQSLSHVLMQFPMPWPKEKHAKHRVYSPHFAATLADVLAPDGCFELVTDQDWYANETAAILGADGRFETSAVEVNPERPFKTRYETKWLEEGRSIYRVTAKVVRFELAPRIFTDQPMDIFRLNSVPESDTAQALAGQKHRSDEFILEIKDVYQSASGWLIGVVVSDDAFAQRFHLEVVAKKDGRVLLKIGQVPRPYFTKGVRASIELVGRLLSGEPA
ncbi:MAG: tRNA (guanosine(46)-N7)-methyltransferase TrmB [Planctomycetes bacterium]|jgi:tRNA (guanine-N7-)-methyltransferase|nr:tRNA (guanosine(46)-N7)-methyltransferase TrmB [Planctomycetota bacterium]MBT4559566.1 tRNA (guanosine(46)-N7)-methyltransferase TrmB [Planctomycetota bacterium]MBT5101290.1 tRNA (guanosine(46)-N7)-methyltransferase TrmB [Planctomycetota bacterium]MBT7012323.1 tRNA (guanosine(46)-N7)-methyltransferase TrmB [Planctomycetota bacterium]